MSAILDCALELAQQKVRFFQVRPDSKLPAVADFSTKATSDPEKLYEYFGHSSFNSGIACGKVSEGVYLVGFDIDNKDGRNGYETLELLAELGEEFPETWSQKTPSGGEHRLFWSPVPIRQGANVLGAGIDLRGEGGYLVGPGSTIGGVPYSVLRHLPIAVFPAWAIAKWEKKATVHALPKSAGKPVANQILALSQSVAYLKSLEPVTEGGRNDACYKAVTQMRDFGLDQSQMLDMLVAHWKCEPLLSDDEMLAVIAGAFKYPKTPAGIAAPENLFPVVEDPIEKDPLDLINENHFYCASNGISRVYWETERRGKFYLEPFPVYVFHENHGAETMLHRGKEAPVTQVWMKSKKRRSYDRLRFDPGNGTAPNEYNTWKGFAVKPNTGPIDPRGEKAVELFFEHCEKNVCRKDKALFTWLVTFMAHIFQRPEDKPEVSLVFQGLKGTGKTIVSMILDHLIGDNSVIVADKAHVLGHFNAMMEDKILVTMDEAFWSGDKQIEGVLKDLITGRTRIITNKGVDSRAAEVFDRIIIIGNEKWAIPASFDERRFAVFKMGEDRRQDRAFFGAMKDGLFKHGGAGRLMARFMAWDLSSADIFTAPQTRGLEEQKLLSMGTFEQWWFQCLQEGRILGHGLDEWLPYLSCRDFYDAFVRQMDADNNRFAKPTRIGAGMIFKHLSPLAGGSKRRDGKRVYEFPPLDILRAEWDEQTEFKNDWN